MTRLIHRFLCLALIAMSPALGRAMDIQWTRMAGQTPVEASPVVGQFSGSGKTEILVLNQGGQLLLWTEDGKAIGPGQDGLVAQLPEGRWTTAPTVVDPATGGRFVVASVKGLVVGLDEKFQARWQYQLPGETAWGRAVSTPLRTVSGSALLFNDSSGTATCLTPGGKVVWTNALAAGPSKAPPQTISLKAGEDSVLIPAGSTLFCCEPTGAVRWRRDLGKEIVTRPEVLPLADRQLLLCGTASGSLFALDMDGNVAWEFPSGDMFSNWLVVLPRREAPPLILFTGLWGNLHAVDVQGHHVWTHLFRAKTRAAPLVLDTGGNGRSEIFVPTFHQRVFAFDEHGQLKDNIRLSGIMPSALVPLTDSASGRPDMLVTTSTLLAYRLRPGLPRSPYGASPPPQNVTLHPPVSGEFHERAALRVSNPTGALINVQLTLTDTQGHRRIVGGLSSRSAYEIPLPAVTGKSDWSLRATATDAAGKLLAETAWTIPPQPRSESPAPPPDELRAWATPAFASFADTRLLPFTEETQSGGTDQISIEPLYLDEADQGACIVASTRNEPTRSRVALTKLTRPDGTAFGGTTMLREVISTGSVNGEKVPDALPALGEAGLLTIPARRSVKIWISVDARGAQPGSYTGQLSVAPLGGEVKKIEFPCTSKF